VDRKDKSITNATVVLSMKNALDIQKKGEKVTGPKKLGKLPLSHIFAI